jgi:hypothetical protein
MEIIESIKQAIAKKDFQKLEDLWTDMVLDKQVNLNDFFTSSLRNACCAS